MTLAGFTVGLPRQFGSAVGWPAAEAEAAANAAIRMARTKVRTGGILDGAQQNRPNGRLTLQGWLRWHRLASVSTLSE